METECNYNTAGQGFPSIALNPKSKIMQLRLQVRDEEGLEQIFKFFVFLRNLGLVCSQIAKIE